jgi:hypothetical protein
MGLRGASDLELLDWLLAELRELGDDRVHAVQALREHRARRARSGALQ